MWSIQISWKGVWITLEKGFESQDAAEWVIARWKQSNVCYGDPFRAIEVRAP